MRHNLLQRQLQLRELEIKICLLNDRFEGKTVVLNGIDTLCRVPTGGVRCDQPYAPYSIKVPLLQYQ